MKVFKHELVAAIKNLKTVLPKGSLLPGLHGILVADGVLTASNSDLTMQIALDAAQGEHFIIPEGALSLIENLPEGEIEITAEGEKIRIRMDKIKNQFPTYPPEEFLYTKPYIDVPGQNVSGKDLIQSLKRVEFACAKDGARPVMCGVCIKRHGGTVDVVSTDGHVVAWDQLDSDGDDMEIIVPHEAVKKLISMGIDDDISLTHDNAHAIFHTNKYTIYTRLINGPYIDFKRAFGELTIQTSTDRRELLAAVSRAKMCDEKIISTKPIRLAFGEECMRIQRVGGDVIYDEKILTGNKLDTAITMGFDGTLLISAIKAFDSDMIYMSMEVSNRPMILASDTSDLRVVVLPVRS